MTLVKLLSARENAKSGDYALRVDALQLGARLAAMVGLLWGSILPLAGQDAAVGQDAAAEQRAFAAAAWAFEDGVYDLAESEFARFVQDYPLSTNLAEAILYQARSALEQNKLAVGVALLTNNVTKAGPWADQYRYREAEAYLQNSNYLAAADTFALLAREFTNSVRLLEASYGEAQARFKLRDFGRVVDLLQQPNGTFQKAAAERANDQFAVRGQLLLAEALFEQKNYQAAERALQRLAEDQLIPEFKWHRQYLICRTRLADQRLAEALDSVTNLLALAAAADQRNLLAESVVMEGEVHERLNEFGAAIKAYEKNLLTNVPNTYARQALIKVIELSLAQDNIANAVQQLDSFLTRHPGDAASDLVLLTLGEVHLKLHLSGVETNRLTVGTNSPLAVTNHLQAAMAQFDKLIATFTNSPFVGKAQLDRGWCFWVAGATNESASAFRAASERLPHGVDQAVARFKLADVLFALKDYTNALRNYRLLVEEFGDSPRVKDTLFDQALYQIVRASLEVNDLNGATDAMKRLLQGFPDSVFRDRSMLLVGQSYTAARRSAEARALLRELARRIPDSPLLPEVNLAIARTYVHENNWTAAIKQYEEWLGQFPTNDLRPYAEFNRAWANFHAGRETNALSLFTNFLARFEKHELAPEAQYWVANYYYGQKDFATAQANFQRIFENTNWPPTHLTYLARLMAGRSAFARQGWNDARGHFTNLVNEMACPTNILAEGFFALGDTITLAETDPGKSPLEKFKEARDAFSKIPLNTPTSPLVPAAWGRIGDCYFQLAAQDPQQYDNATNSYGRAMMPGADVTVRFQAEWKLGQTLEKMAQAPGKSASETADFSKAAFVHYTNILYGKNLHDTETADPIWVEKAGLAAGRLKEELKQWDVAVKIYQRVSGLLPQLRPALEKRIERAREQQQLQKE